MLKIQYGRSDVISSDLKEKVKDFTGYIGLKVGLKVETVSGEK